MLISNTAAPYHGERFIKTMRMTRLLKTKLYD